MVWWHLFYYQSLCVVCDVDSYLLRNFSFDGKGSRRPSDEDVAMTRKVV